MNGPDCWKRQRNNGGFPKATTSITAKRRSQRSVFAIAFSNVTFLVATTTRRNGRKLLLTISCVELAIFHKKAFVSSQLYAEFRKHQASHCGNSARVGGKVDYHAVDREC